MEAIFIDIADVTFGAAFTGLLVLLAAAAGIFLAGMAEAEAAGARFTWAEWPLPETVAPPAEEKVRLAA